MIADAPVKTITYTEAIKIIQESNEKFEAEVKWAATCSPSTSASLTEKHFKQPVAVINYPKDIKLSTCLNDEGTDDAPGVPSPPWTSLCPAWANSSAAHSKKSRLDVLDSRIEEMGFIKDDYWWYRDRGKYGTSPARRLRPGL
ncbi:MAG: hypothetical protein R3B67_06510 [Phycisphaerales bacterium]